MLWFKYIKINIISVLEYPIATSMTTLARILSAFLEIIGLFFLFDRFNSLLNYSFYEVGLCYFVIRLSFALAHNFGKGFNLFGNFAIRNGKFDSFLIRPRSLILQVLGCTIDPNDFGVSLQYIVLLTLFVWFYGVNFTVLKCLILILTVISGTSIFLGIFILSASICFFSTKGVELLNVFIDGGVKLSSYPITIYGKYISRFFSFIIPFGCVNYLPISYIADKITDYKLLYMISPLAGIVFIIPCIFIWFKCSRYYKSTGS